MIHQKRLFNKFDVLGPGGWNCPCCGPALSFRKVCNRAVKRGRWKRMLDKMVREDLAELKAEKPKGGKA